MLSGNVDSKVVENVNILPEIISIVEETLVDSDTLILMRSMCLLIVLMMSG